MWVNGFDNWAIDPDGTEIVSARIVKQPTNGMLEVDGKVTGYRPSHNFTGTDSWAVVFKDAQGEETPVLNVTMKISSANPPEGAPTAVNSSMYTWAGLNSVAAPTCTGGAHSDYAVEVTSNPGKGSAGYWLAFLTYNPASNYTGTDSFRFICYNVIDETKSNFGPNTATMTVHSVQPISMIMNMNQPQTVNLGPDIFNYNLVSQPENGSASIVGNALTFTPKTNWSGSTQITFRTQNGFT